LALASRILESTPPSRSGAPDPAVGRLLPAARAAAVPGWEGAVVEAAGLVVRTLHPGRLEAVDRAFAAAGGSARGHFWHGLGRGAYFAPTRMLPSARVGERPLAEARTKPPSGADDPREDAESGLCWALALVNLRAPEVVAAFLGSHGGSGPFEQGVAAACLAWAVSVGVDPVLEGFLEYEPEGTTAAAAWRRHVAGPCRHVLDRFVPALAAGDGFPWGEIFRYRPLEELADRAAGRPA
jgi:hypothetical protein